MKIKNVTSYGAGLIGSGWATNFIMNDLNVTLFDISQEGLDKSKLLVQQNLELLKNEGIINQDKINDYMSNLKYTTDIEEAVKHADLIQENCPERLDIKHFAIEQIEKYAKKDAIIASSTSGLLISDIAKKANNPERIMGAHPYTPVHLIPLVEISKWEKTNEEVVKTAYDFYKGITKEPIILQKEAPGFISNRLQAALFREAADLVLRGVCTIDEVDRAVCYGPGLRYALMGSHAIYQLGGGAHGIEGILKHIGVTSQAWYEDMAKWTKFPEEYLEVVQEKTNEALKMRLDEHGHTNEELSLFRDKGLLHILKYHGKI